MCLIRIRSTLLSGFLALGLSFCVHQLMTSCRMYDSYIDMNRFIINVGFDVGGRSLFGDKQKVRIVFGDAHRKNVFFCIYLDPEDF